MTNQDKIDRLWLHAQALNAQKARLLDEADELRRKATALEGESLCIVARAMAEEAKQTFDRLFA